jgi:aquaporin related protein
MPGGYVGEMFITAQVVVAVFMLATEKHKATFIAPVGIGMSVFASVCMAATYTGAGMNPARAFAVCVATGNFPHYYWIYWVGPDMGAMLATTIYLLIRKLEYWTVNPDVDDYQSKRLEKAFWKSRVGYDERHETPERGIYKHKLRHKIRKYDT